MNEVKENVGWGKPGLSRKWHYFNGLVSLCGKWMFTGYMEDEYDDHTDNCTACKKKLAPIRKKQGVRNAD